MTYRAAGKQVLRGTEHVCDARDETYAQIIADALNGERERAAVLQIVPDNLPSIAHSLLSTISIKPGDAVTADIGGQRFTSHPGDMHRVVQTVTGDYRCTCGRAWDVSDGDDTCPGATS